MKGPYGVPLLRVTCGRFWGKFNRSLCLADVRSNQSASFSTPLTSVLGLQMSCSAVQWAQGFQAGSVAGAAASTKALSVQ